MKLLVVHFREFARVSGKSTPFVEYPRLSAFGILTILLKWLAAEY